MRRRAAVEPVIGQLNVNRRGVPTPIGVLEHISAALNRGIPLNL
jgi:hypothetical protein